MAINTSKASASEQIAKLKEEEKRLAEQLEAKRKEVAEKASALRQSAIDEAMDSFVKPGFEALKELGLSIGETASLLASQLGLPFTKAGKVKASAKSDSTGVKRPANTSRPCPVCNFVTVPHHDGRSHTKHREPFTAEELAERGMVKAA